VGGGAINTSVTQVVGTGLSLQSRIDAGVLGMNPEEAEAWQARTEAEFRLWAESTDCDVTRHQNLYGLQALAFRSMLESGDTLVMLAKPAPQASAPIRLALQIIEADRISNPSLAPDRDGLVAGVEADASGAPEAYHVASGNPHRRTGAAATKPLSWSKVPAFAGRLNRRVALHLFERRRPGQTRGVPYLASVIEPLKQLERYTEAELMAAVVSGLFTVFVTSEGTGRIEASAAQGGGGGGGAQGSWDGKLGNGLVVDLSPGEKVETSNPGRPNAQFDPFVQAVIRQIGMVLEIPYEVLVKHYTSSYTAARAAILDAWRLWRCRRDFLATYLCQPVYEYWLDMAVSQGRILAPGYFSDPLVRRAWAGAAWVGDGPGSVDPLKEVQAAKMRCELGISTLAAESVLHDGGDWNTKVIQRGREEKRRAAEGLPPLGAVANMQLEPPPAAPGE
jgi:lambda family phage portal protein